MLSTQETQHQADPLRSPGPSQAPGCLRQRHGGVAGVALAGLGRGEGAELPQGAAAGVVGGDSIAG